MRSHGGVYSCTSHLQVWAFAEWKPALLGCVDFSEHYVCFSTRTFSCQVLCCGVLWLLRPSKKGLAVSWFDR